MPCSRNSFKMMAILLMLIDHVGLFIFDNNILFRIVGRMAFPMFVYLLADGFHRTKNVGAYLFRLAILYVISYVPHSLAMSGEPFYIVQNIYASLFLYLILYCFLAKSAVPAWAKVVVSGLVCLLSVVLHLQYGWYGVAVAIVMFYTHNLGVQKSSMVLVLLGLIYGHMLGFPLQAVGGLSIYLVPYQEFY